MEGLEKGKLGKEALGSPCPALACWECDCV